MALGPGFLSTSNPMKHQHYNVRVHRNGVDLGRVTVIRRDACSGVPKRPWLKCDLNVRAVKGLHPESEGRGTCLLVAIWNAAEKATEDCPRAEVRKDDPELKMTFTVTPILEIRG